MKAIQTGNNKGGKPGSRFDLKNNRYIKHNHSINKAGLLSSFTFLLLALTCLFPISKGEQSTEAVTGTAQSSSLTLSVADNTASVELDVNSTEGTFASSTAENSASFSVTTNNFSGYTLSITGGDDDGKLYDATKKYSLEPLTSATSEADFSSTANLNGKWGYKPSKFNSAVNENYLPAPTTTASTLDKTSAANTTANDYTISLGLRANYATAANTYSNAFVITAVSNPIAYVITYNSNTTDTVSNMPATQNSTTSATSITLTNTRPTRTNYSFLGWCNAKPTTANSTDSCSGTTFQPNGVYGIDKTTENNTILYAMWKADSFNVNFAAGTGGTVDRSTQSVPHGLAITTSSNTVAINGVTTTATPSTGYQFSSWTNNCGTTMPASTCTITANFTKRSFTISFTSNTGGTVNRSSQSVPYGTAITVNNTNGTITTNSVTTTATASTGYEFAGWTNNCGTTMPASNCTITATWKQSSLQNFTAADCSTTAKTIVDSRDGKSYRVAKVGGICTMIDNLAIGKGQAMTPANTNIASNYTMPSNDLTSGNTYTEARIHEGTGNQGNWYNYCAATAGTICSSSNSAEATYDICPKGWRLPTHAEQTSIGGSGSGSSYVTTNVTAFNAVAAGYYNTGSLRNSGTNGYWWSSTAYDTANRYNLLYGTSNGLYSGSNYDRYNGLSVRCVLK